MSSRVRRSRGTVVVVLASALLTAACGSTVQNRGADSTQGGLDALGSGASTEGGGGLGAAPDPGRTQAAGHDSAVSTATGPIGTGSAGALAPGLSPPGEAERNSVSKVAATDIRLGYIYSSDQEAVGSSLGLKGIVAGDTGRQYRAIASDINRSGGVLGRKIVLVGHDESTANELNNPSDEENKACTDFVQDHPVFAVLSAGVFLSPCLAKHGIPSIGAGGLEDPATINQQLVFDGGGMLTDVLAKAYVERLAAQRYFTGWDTATGRAGAAPVKVGLIYQDLPVWRHYYAEIKSVFKAHGIIVDPNDEFRYAPTADSLASQSQAAVLRFRSDGVTHVFGAALLFFKAADNQSYHPRYALDSLAPPALLAQNVGPSQFHGALGIGWRPTQDVDQPQDPGPVSARATKCTRLMKEAGEDVATRTVLYLSHIECEQMWSIAAAIAKGGGVSRAQVTRGFGALGRPVPTLSFGERWAPDRHASNTTVADLVYVDSCSCFAYTKARTSF
jgi:predicted small secreted protein